MVRLLITGGAGCLGSSLVEHYLRAEVEICVVDAFVTGRRDNLPQNSGISIVEGSVADAGTVRAAFQQFRPTHVIHAAASYKNPSDWHGDASTNVLGSINVARSAEQVGVARLVNLQTALCYGRPQEIPIPVDHRLAPSSSYGVSKTAGEAAILASSLDVVSLRLANVCGPRLSIGPLPMFYKRLKSGQDCFATAAVRDFLDMSDFLKLVDIILREESPAGIYNVSSGEGHSIADVLHEVARVLEVGIPEVEPIPVGEDDVPQVVLDPSATVKALGWKAQVGFQEIIARQIAWYENHGTGEIYSHLADPRPNSGQASGIRDLSSEASSDG